MRMGKMVFVGIAAALYASGAATFSVTPYVQHPATNAMSVIWFAKGGSGEAATISWRPAAGGAAVHAQRGGHRDPAERRAGA